MNNLSIRLKFSLDSPLHVTGDRIHKGITKSAYIRDIRDDRIYAIPATTIKGILRHRLEYFLRGLGKPCCYDQDCGKCIPCDIFGHPRSKSPLFFQDASCEATIKIRPGVRINRKRKVALDKHLYSIETVEAEKFQTEIRGFFESYERALYVCGLIWMAARFCEGFGAGRSHGLGWSRLDEFEAEIDGEKIALATIEQKVREVLR